MRERLSFELIPFRFCFVGWFRLLRDLWRLGFGTELEGQWWIRALSAERGREECWKWGRGRREGGAGRREEGRRLLVGLDRSIFMPFHAGFVSRV